MTGFLGRQGRRPESAPWTVARPENRWRLRRAQKHVVPKFLGRQGCRPELAPRTEGFPENRRRLRHAQWHVVTGFLARNGRRPKRKPRASRGVFFFQSHATTHTVANAWRIHRMPETLPLRSGQGWGGESSRRASSTFPHPLPMGEGISDALWFLARRRLFQSSETATDTAATAPAPSNPAAGRAVRGCTATLRTGSGSGTPRRSVRCPGRRSCSG